MSIEEWRNIIQKNFPDLVMPAEIGLSVLCQLLIKDITNPFGLVYIDVPSSGKTITLNFFSEISKLVYTTDNFTPASFVSHAANVKKEELGKIDLLPKIKGKMLIVRDLATIFGQRQEDLQKTIGVLTRVFDGEGLQLEGGCHGGRGYQGDYNFMFLGASTPIGRHVWTMMGNFGARLFFMNLNSKDKSTEELVEQLIKNSVREKEKECRRVTNELVDSLWSCSDSVNWDKSKDDMCLIKQISRLAQLLACLRGTVNVWINEDEEQYKHKEAVIEKPDRINQVLYNLARGHAVACGRESINEKDLGIVSNVVFSSAPKERVKLLIKLSENDGVVVVEDIIETHQKSRPTALNYMKMLVQLGIAENITSNDFTRGRSEMKIRLREKFRWVREINLQKDILTVSE